LPVVREPDQAPSLLEILRGYDWHARAACRDEPNPNTFFPDITNLRVHSTAPGVLLPLLICDTCPVRRQCLEESLRTWSYVRGTFQLRARGGESNFEFGFTSLTIASGTWGGVTELERLGERDRPVSEAIERLERLREGRLRKRIRGYLRERRTRNRHPVASRVDAILTERGWKVPSGRERTDSLTESTSTSTSPARLAVGA
jgi:hypothetical protein